MIYTSTYETHEVSETQNRTRLVRILNISERPKIDESTRNLLRQFDSCCRQELWKAYDRRWCNIIENFYCYVQYIMYVVYLYYMFLVPCREALFKVSVCSLDILKLQVGKTCLQRESIGLQKLIM